MEGRKLLKLIVDGCVWLGRVAEGDDQFDGGECFSLLAGKRQLV
jgi:hypothetical protein